MKTGKLLLINAVIFIIIVGLGIGGYYYYYNETNFIQTDDAKVMGDIVPVAADSAGKLTEWKVNEGDQVTKGQALGKVNIGSNTVDIQAPIDGTIVQNKGLVGQMVAPGQALADVVDFSKLYILANVEETEIKDISVGQEVDITVDANSDTRIKGKVEQIGQATNSVFSLIPQNNASGDYTKVVQRIPVKISMDNYPDGLVPGMNAEVKIHK
ncbi:efflux RND transporter periplasmic adaptor subunit [Thermoactinomyces daqus]|uniref:Efflux RND transporter periplasmic adaptor subunit n=1 Tax=Thermoactinomyces daqus TaxID=1329516 RepID=A0A7W2AHA5_9BACL|nr:HlyD family efflux transporter periplasmic adaptor subunit [Thermoactinomyces daqus]MBA4541648.1 efflux RND transporter periplasmic adaptor subunit [Thermoactinomyces daqus]